MKIIAKRLCRLECAVANRRSVGRSPGDILRERKRRRFGEAYTDAPPVKTTNDCGRPLSVAEILRSGRGHRMTEAR